MLNSLNPSSSSAAFSSNQFERIILRPRHATLFMRLHRTIQLFIPHEHSQKSIHITKRTELFMKIVSLTKEDCYIQLKEKISRQEQCLSNFLSRGRILSSNKNRGLFIIIPECNITCFEEDVGETSKDVAVAEARGRSEKRYKRCHFKA